MNDSRALVLNVLLESSSSSEDEEFVKLLNMNRKKPKVKNYISEVIDEYTDEEFRKHLRLSRETCDKLIENYEISEFLKNDSSHGGKEEVSAKKQILSFLWFAGNHVVIRNVAELFDMSESTFHGVVTKVIDFLTDLAPRVIKFPKTREEMEGAAASFKQISNFPNVIGCVDGTYINIKTPANKMKNTYVNRHDTPSLTLQGICDSKKKFIDVFTGTPGKIHDSRIFSLSFISQVVKNLPETYHLLGDAAYPLSVNLLTPYRDYGNLTLAQINYNKTFCATRVLIENAFGLLKGRFRQLQLIYFHSVERCSKFIVACCVLHNICIDTEDFFDEEEEKNNDVNCDDQQDNVDNRSRLVGERKRNMICDSLNDL